MLCSYNKSVGSVEFILTPNVCKMFEIPTCCELHGGLQLICPWQISFCTEIVKIVQILSKTTLLYTKDTFQYLSLYMSSYKLKPCSSNTTKSMKTKHKYNSSLTGMPTKYIYCIFIESSDLN